MPVARVVLWIALIASLALLVKGWSGDGIAGIWFAAALALLLLVVASGSTWPRLEMFYDLLWCGPRAGDQAALSFDGVPDAESLEELLGCLERHGVCATFFVEASASGSAEPFPEKVEQRARLQRLVAAGHQLGLWYRGDGSGDVAAYLSGGIRDLRAAVGEQLAVLDAVRPERRRAIASLSKAARDASLTVVGASWGWLGSIDTSRGNVEVAAGSLLDVPAAGSSVETLDCIIEAAQRNGVRWVPLRDWLS